MKRNWKKWHRKLYFNKTEGTFYVLPTFTVDYCKYSHYKWQFSLCWLRWYLLFSGEPEILEVEE